MDDFERTLIESLKDLEHTNREQLIEARLWLGITQSELAERIGTKQNRIA